MAEAIANESGYYAESAGTRPNNMVSNNARLALDELGINTSNLYPKSVDQIDSDGFDMIISMGCGVECPALPIDLDWGLDDPEGKDMNFFRETRDKIVNLISELSKQTDA
tara:strand:+ start:322 stop:651 length:330 start_codon:yes stop_codon:yes gene_type:complete